MFDISFWELGLIAVVALVVIGPERLPGVARNVGLWIGRARRLMQSVQADIHAEAGKADELKRLLEEQIQVKSLHDILEQNVDTGESRKPVPRAKSDNANNMLKAMPDEQGDTADEPPTPTMKDEPSKHG
jgi:sec-independent protein translocase protein TatB